MLIYLLKTEDRECEKTLKPRKPESYSGAKTDPKNQAHSILKIPAHSDFWSLVKPAIRNILAKFIQLYKKTDFRLRREMVQYM